MALANRPKTAVCAKPSRPTSDSRRACEILPSAIILSIIDAHSDALSGDSDNDRVMRLVGAGNWAEMPRKASCAPMADFAFFIVNHRISKNSANAAMVIGESGALAKKPKSSKYPIVGIKRIRHADESMILDRQL